MSTPVLDWPMLGWLFRGRDAGHDLGRPLRRAELHRQDDDREDDDRIGTASADAALLARLQAGDESALAEIVHTYSSRLSRVAFTLLGSADRVSDVLQEIFVSLWERRAVLDVRSSLLAYLYRAVRNRSANVLRQDRRRQRLTDRLTAERVVEHETTLETFSSDPSDAEEFLHGESLSKELRDALALVPAGPRQVFLLHHAGDLDYSEIAAMLGVTIPTVRTMMYRATRRLAQYYSGRGSEK